MVWEVQHQGRYQILPWSHNKNIKFCSNIFLRNPTSIMMICPQKNNRISRKMPKKDIYHTSSSGRTSDNTTNWRPIFRTTSKQVITACPRNIILTSISWISTPIVQWWSNPHQNECHFIKSATETITNMNTMTGSSGNTRSATTVEIQVTQNTISRKNLKRLLIRSRMTKSWESEVQANPEGQTSQI